MIWVLNMTDSILKHIGIKEVWEKMAEVKELSHGRTDKLYIEMHVETLKELILDPELDSYISYSRASVINRDQIETLLGVKIFTHTDNTKRFMLTIAYRAEVLLGDNND